MHVRAAKWRACISHKNGDEVALAEMCAGVYVCMWVGVCVGVCVCVSIRCAAVVNG